MYLDEDTSSLHPKFKGKRKITKVLNEKGNGNDMHFLKTVFFINIFLKSESAKSRPLI